MGERIALHSVYIVSLSVAHITEVVEESDFLGEYLNPVAPPKREERKRRGLQ